MRRVVAALAVALVASAAAVGGVAATAPTPAGGTVWNPNQHV